MRLVAWNTNYNNRRRSFEEACALTDSLCADIIVLSETAPPERPSSVTLDWVKGDSSPVLAVVAKNGLQLRPHSANVGAPPLVAAFSVHGHIAFNLLAAWPVKFPGGVGYHNILMNSLDHFSEFIQVDNFILAGDLNSSVGVIGQELKHLKFVDRAKNIEISSVYHEQSGEPHGSETVSTHRHGGKQFHIDYCFVSRQLIAASTISILHSKDWESRSDHFPLVLDIPDSAFSK